MFTFSHAVDHPHCITVLSAEVTICDGSELGLNVSCKCRADGLISIHRPYIIVLSLKPICAYADTHAHMQGTACSETTVCDRSTYMCMNSSG